MAFGQHEQEGIPIEYDRLKEFMDRMLEGIIKRTQELLKNQKELRGD